MGFLRNVPTVGVLLLFLWGGALAPVVHLGSHVQAAVQAPAPVAEHPALTDEAPAAPVLCLICEGLVFWVDHAPETTSGALVYADLHHPAPDAAPFSSTALRSTSRAPPTTA